LMRSAVISRPLAPVPLGVAPIWTCFVRAKRGDNVTCYWSEARSALLSLCRPAGWEEGRLTASACGACGRRSSTGGSPQLRKDRGTGGAAPAIPAAPKAAAPRRHGGARRVPSHELRHPDRHPAGQLQRPRDAGAGKLHLQLRRRLLQRLHGARALGGGRGRACTGEGRGCLPERSALPAPARLPTLNPCNTTEPAGPEVVCAIYRPPHRRGGSREPQPR
jgi:hypothetical protein